MLQKDKRKMMYGVMPGSTSLIDTKRNHSQSNDKSGGANAVNLKSESEFILRQAFGVNKILDWKVISEIESTRRAHWSAEDDQKLIDLATLYKGKKWRLIHQEFPNRTPVQLRDRWAHQLSPMISKAKWT